MRTDPYQRQRKIVCAVLCAILCAALAAGAWMICRHGMTQKEETEAVGIVEETEAAWETERVPESGTEGTERVPESGTEGTEHVPESGTEEIAITNINEYATDYDDRDRLLVNSLTEYIDEKGIDAQGGTIFHTYIMEDDPDSVYYFVQLDDPGGTIAVLLWNKNEGAVTASGCSYTADEIIRQAW